MLTKPAVDHNMFSIMPQLSSTNYLAPLITKTFVKPGILIFRKLQNDAHKARCRTMQRRRYITMNLQLLASILTYWTSKIKYDFLVAVLARTFVNILNLLLSLYYLVFCESQCHCGYIDMFSFQLFTNIICKNTDIRDNAVTMATLIWIFSSVYTQMVFNMSTIL